MKRILICTGGHEATDGQDKSSGRAFPCSGLRICQLSIYGASQINSTC